MQRINTPILPLLARILMAAIFITSGFAKLTSPSATIGYIGSAGLPLAPLAYVVAVIVELGGGLAILVGFFTPFVALAFTLFCIVTAYAFHYHPEDMMQMINFWKNICMAGGFLALAALGAGAWSVDAIRLRRRGVATP